MKNILITGGAGFIATNLINFLINKRKNIKITSIDNYYSGSKLNHIKSKNVKYLRLSTLDINKNKILKKENFDMVFILRNFLELYLVLKITTIVGKQILLVHMR